MIEGTWRLFESSQSIFKSSSKTTLKSKLKEFIKNIFSNSSTKYLLIFIYAYV
jgi:hypothetical protein